MCIFWKSHQEILIPWDPDPKLRITEEINVRRLENFLPPIFCILDSWVWLICCNFSFGASLIAQLVKNPPVIQETPV